MSETMNTATAPDRLAPDLDAEVRRNLVLWLFGGVALAAGFSALFAAAVDPGLSGVFGGVAAHMFAAFLTFLVPMSFLLLAMVHLFDCWPILLRRRFVQDRFGVAAEELSGAAWRRAMGLGAFWAAATRGAIVGWAFLSATVFIGWALTGRWSFGAPSAVVVALAAQFSARAWFVRRAVVQDGGGANRGAGLRLGAPL